LSSLEGEKVAEVPVSAFREIVDGQDVYSVATVRSFPPVVVFKVADEFVAVGRYCPHKRADLYKYGVPDAASRTIFCLMHGHEYHMEEGACAQADSCEKLVTYRVRLGINGGVVEVYRPEPSLD
jgi:nitrite reductase/ring-hydroxylating ferredoxin subunit